MEHHNVLEILRDAMDLEREGAKFYKKAAKTCKNQDVSDLFKMLSEEEMMHFDQLEVLFDEFCENNEWMVEADIASTPKKELDFDNEVFDEEDLDHDFNEIEAINLGIEAENHAIKLYTTALEECNLEHRKGCEIFQWLIDFEKSHLHQLKDLKKKLKG